METIENKHECTICSCEFDIDAEGGILGCIGILPVAFCPTCQVGVADFGWQMHSLEKESGKASPYWKWDNLQSIISSMNCYRVLCDKRKLIKGKQ